MSNGIFDLLRRRAQHMADAAAAAPEAFGGFGGFDFASIAIGPRPAGSNPAGFARPLSGGDGGFGYGGNQGGAGAAQAGPIVVGAGAAPPAYSPNVGPVSSPGPGRIGFGLQALPVDAATFAPVPAGVSVGGDPQPAPIGPPAIITAPPSSPAQPSSSSLPSASPPPAAFGPLDPAIATAIAAQPAPPSINPVSAPPPAPLVPRAGAPIAV